ncbi:MAG TPA: winged helix-turn-helix transcriptional regulator [Hymenobacter sp.]|jgi:DNA-binding HxlR family transcriptional regulator
MKLWLWILVSLYTAAYYRFRDIEHSSPGVSLKVLAEELKDLGPH